MKMSGYANLSGTSHIQDGTDCNDLKNRDKSFGLLNDRSEYSVVYNLWGSTEIAYTSLMWCPGKLGFRCALALSFSAALVVSLRSQTPNVAPSAKPQIRVITNEVIAAVTVTDPHGEFILDLSQKDFHVFDDGTEQTIDRWDLGEDPLAVALVIETSSHIAMMAPVIRGMGSIFTETVMALNGEAAVITYDTARWRSGSLSRTIMTTYNRRSRKWSSTRRKCGCTMGWPRPWSS
jgi:hypothetical protein